MNRINNKKNLNYKYLFFCLVIFFTIGGNSLVCIAVIRERNLQNTNNYFLTSLAFTDCLVACLVMPLAVTVELIGHFPFDALACNVWLTFDVCCCTSSIWHMRSWSFLFCCLEINSFLYLVQCHVFGSLFNTSISVKIRTK